MTRTFKLTTIEIAETGDAVGTFAKLRDELQATPAKNPRSFKLSSDG